MSELFIELSSPIKAHGEEVMSLTFVAPRTKDVMELGLPTLLIPSADGKTIGVEIRQAVVGRYISRLAKIPMNSVEALSLSDFSQCTALVMGFFQETSGEASVAPASD